MAIRFAGICVVSLLFLSGCVPLVVGGTAAGVTVAQERTVGRAVDDVTVHSKISHRFLQSDVKNLFSQTSIEVSEGVVLLTGQVKKPETSIKAVQLVWQVEGVKEVINEIQVTDRSTVQDFVKDSWITSQVKGRLIAEKNLRSVNYSVETVNRHVYLMGIAQDHAEMQRAVAVASRVKGVQQVISHVRVKTDPRRTN